MTDINNSIIYLLGSIPFIFFIIVINGVYIAYSHNQIFILINFGSLLILLFVTLIKVFNIYLISFFVAIVYAGALCIIFLFVIMLIDQTEIYISDNTLRYNAYKFIPLVLFLIDLLFNLLWPFINQYQQVSCNKISKLDIDTLLSDFIFELLGYLFQRKLVNGLLGSLEMFNVNINISNLKNNENDIQIISNILYNDMSVLLLSVGFTLFISLILIVNKRS